MNAFGGRRTICAVRRRPERTPAQEARLCEDLVATSHLLRREHERRRVVFQENVAVQGNVAVEDNYLALAHAGVALG